LSSEKEKLLISSENLVCHLNLAHPFENEMFSLWCCILGHPFPSDTTQKLD